MIKKATVRVTARRPHVSSDIFFITVQLRIRECLVTQGGANPVQGWTGPEGSSRVRVPDFKTIGTLRW